MHTGRLASQSATNLAARFLPPEPRSYFAWFLAGSILLVVGAVLTVHTPVSGEVALVLGALILLAASGNKTANKREYDRRISMYERGWICLQCGHAWIPIIH